MIETPQPTERPEKARILAEGFQVPIFRDSPNITGFRNAMCDFDLDEEEDGGGGVWHGRLASGLGGTSLYLTVQDPDNPDQSWRYYLAASDFATAAIEDIKARKALGCTPPQKGHNANGVPFNQIELDGGETVADRRAREEAEGHTDYAARQALAVATKKARDQDRAAAEKLFRLDKKSLIDEIEKRGIHLELLFIHHDEVIGDSFEDWWWSDGEDATLRARGLPLKGKAPSSYHHYRYWDKQTMPNLRSGDYSIVFLAMGMTPSGSMYLEGLQRRQAFEARGEDGHEESFTSRVYEIDDHFGTEIEPSDLASEIREATTHQKGTTRQGRTRGAIVREIAEATGNTNLGDAAGRLLDRMIHGVPYYPPTGAKASCAWIAPDGRIWACTREEHNDLGYSIWGELFPGEEPRGPDGSTTTSEEALQTVKGFYRVGSSDFEVSDPTVFGPNTRCPKPVLMAIEDIAEAFLVEGNESMYEGLMSEANRLENGEDFKPTFVPKPRNQRDGD